MENTNFEQQLIFQKAKTELHARLRLSVASDYYLRNL